MKRLCLYCLLAVGLLSGCHRNDYSPKPTAYLRIDLPEKEYTCYDTATLPFTFERGNDCTVVWKRNHKGEKWIDLYYPTLRGVVFLSYKPIHGLRELNAQIDTAHQFLAMHFDHSSGIDEKQYIDADNHIYATTSRLGGTRVASTYQFWATDSNHHFLRGSLYLDYTPNNDSLAPLIDYIRDDVDHLIETLRWR